MRKSTLALVIGIAVLLVWGAPAALARVALRVPATVEADKAAPFSVKASDTTSVVFSVDGKRRWTKHTGGREFRRAGAITLSAGQHQLEVRATNSHGQDSISEHTVIVKAPSQSGSSSKGITSSGAGTSSGSANGSGTSGSTTTKPVTTVPTSPVTTPTAPAAPTTPPVEESVLPTQPTAPTPTPAPTPPSTPPTSSEVLFSGKAISQFYLNQSAPGAVTEVPDPAGSGESVFQMTVQNSDVYPITPTENPRAELVSQPIFHSGSEFWASSKFYLPSSFPSSVPGWLTLMEGPYGEPFNGTPPWHLEVTGTSIQWSRNGTYNWDVPWKMPLVRGSWVSVMLHERFASDGWVEMWVNGQPISFFSSGGYNPKHVTPTTKLSMETMDASTNKGPSAIHLMNYREVGMFSSVTVDEGQLKIGTTRTAVEN